MEGPDDAAHTGVGRGSGNTASSPEEPSRLTDRSRRVLGDPTGLWRAVASDDDASDLTDPDLWRSLLLSVMLRVVGLLGLLVAIPSVAFAVAEGLYLVIVVDAIALVTVAVLIWSPSLTHLSRSLGLLAIAYGLGVFLFAIIGPIAGMFLMAVPVLAAVLLGTRPAVSSLVVIAATMVLLGFLPPFSTRLAEASTNDPASWLLTTINFMFVAGIITLSCAALIGRLEKSLERSRRLAIAVEQSDNGIAIADLDGRVTYVNASARRLGLASVTDVRQMLAGATPPRPDGIDDVGSNWHGTMTLAGERSRFVEATTRAVDDRGVRRLVVVMRDVTAERELHEQMRRTEKLQALGTLVGGAAHDFNNALASVIGLAELLADEVDEPASRELIDQILLASDRARDVVRNLMTFVRHDRAERRPTVLAQVLRDGLPLWRASVPAQLGVELDIAAGAEAAEVVLDPPEIHHVISNLVANAAHAMRDMPRGAIDIALERVVHDDRSLAAQQSLEGTPEMLRLTVTDRGVGIDPEVLAYVFDPFFTTKGLEGTGLGLAGVHGTVTSLGGDISIESTPGIATVVSVRLPVASVPGAPMIAAAPETIDADGSEHAAVREVHAVVVDDEIGILHLVQRQLARRGVTVVTFEMATRAVDYIADPTHLVDVVVTDLTMPSMTGIDLIRAVRARRPELPIIVMSGYGPGLRAEDRAALGVSLVIDKPFTGDALWKAVASATSPSPKPLGRA